MTTSIGYRRRMTVPILIEIELCGGIADGTRLSIPSDVDVLQIPVLSQDMTTFASKRDPEIDYISPTIQRYEVRRSERTSSGCYRAVFTPPQPSAPRGS